ncbi:MAG: hypothetical protein LBO63_02815 [Oscillospiraceae bacterium]|jgi:predicted heme/steroid binding protein|nr:hypothetical protein [Oscillospiraceae bacterium]
MRKIPAILTFVLIAVIIVGCAKKDAEVPDVQFTAATLAEYDGKNGHPAYIAVNGLVYDVSNDKNWIDGEHHGYSAGRDLSVPFGDSHRAATLRKLPIVGTYID